MDGNELDLVKVAGVSLPLLVMALVEAIKGVFPKWNPQIVAMVLGALAGAMGFLYTKGVPATMQDAIVMIVFVALGIIGPSGFYDVLTKRRV